VVIETTCHPERNEVEPKDPFLIKSGFFDYGPTPFAQNDKENKKDRCPPGQRLFAKGAKKKRGRKKFRKAVRWRRTSFVIHITGGI